MIINGINGYNPRFRLVLAEIEDKKSVFVLK